MAIENPTAEEWRAVVGYEGFYEVSDLGRVRSLDRTIQRKGQGPHTIKGRVLSPSPDGGGYLGVMLSVHGKARRAVIHRIVLLAFCGMPGEGEQADHINFDRSDNRLCNLRWIHHSENSRRIDQNGRRPTGESHRSSVLDAEDVRAIRMRCASGERQRTVAESFGISQCHVALIVLRRRWASVA